MLVRSEERKNRSYRLNRTRSKVVRSLKKGLWRRFNSMQDEISELRWLCSNGSGPRDISEASGLARRFRQLSEKLDNAMVLVEFGEHAVRGWYDSILETHVRLPRGVDIRFELAVARAIEEQGPESCYREVLSFGKHRYVPHFMLGPHIILEACGFPSERYWEHYREKIIEHVRHGHFVFVIVSGNLHEKSKAGLPQSGRVAIIKLSEFKHAGGPRNMLTRVCGGSAAKT